MTNLWPRNSRGQAGAPKSADAMKGLDQQPMLDAAPLRGLGVEGDVEIEI